MRMLITTAVVLISLLRCGYEDYPSKTVKCYSNGTLFIHDITRSGLIIVNRRGSLMLCSPYRTCNANTAYKVYPSARCVVETTEGDKQ